MSTGNPYNNSYFIRGERRIGKTTLLYQLAVHLRKVEDADFWFIPLYIDLEGTEDEGFFHFLMEEILNGVLILPEANDEIHPSLSEFIYDQTPNLDYTDREFARDLRHLIGYLEVYAEKRNYSKQLKIVLLLDEIDVMNSYSSAVQQRLRRILIRDFASILGAVVAGIHIAKESERTESPWYA